MRKLLIIMSGILALNASAQKFFTKTGSTKFKASVEAFEPVEAENNSTTVVLNTQTGDIASLLFIKAFHFEIALMEEHFNENYMDSDKHSKATFKGKIVDFDLEKLSTEKTEFQLKGEITIRGVKKEVITMISICKEGNKVLMSSNFTVKPEDFGIEIPSIVQSKIAKEINIDLDYELKEKK